MFDREKQERKKREREETFGSGDDTAVLRAELKKRMETAADEFDVEKIRGLTRELERRAKSRGFLYGGEYAGGFGDMRRAVADGEEFSRLSQTRRPAQSAERLRRSVAFYRAALAMVLAVCFLNFALVIPGLFRNADGNRVAEKTGTLSPANETPATEIKTDEEDVPAQNALNENAQFVGIDLSWLPDGFVVADSWDEKSDAMIKYYISFVSGDNNEAITYAICKPLGPAVVPQYELIDLLTQ